MASTSPRASSANFSASTDEGVFFQQAAQLVVTQSQRLGGSTLVVLLLSQHGFQQIPLVVLHRAGKIHRPLGRLWSRRGWRRGLAGRLPGALAGVGPVGEG